VLRDYRLRVVSMLRDCGMTERSEAPADSREERVEQYNPRPVVAAAQP
jgi:hypothetical protein